MATKIENSAVGSVMSNPDASYNHGNLIRYHTSMALIERLVEEGLLSRADYRRASTILSQKYGIPQDGIFAEVA